MAPQQQVFHMHPFGWEKDPEEERFKISTLDYLTACTYQNFALFFRVEDAEKEHVVKVLKEGLERTLAQARHLCGTIEKHPAGGHCFYKKKDSTVQLFVQRLEADEYPSFDDIEAKHFSATVLGDLNTWSVYPMTYGEKAACDPSKSPVVAAFKANFVRGGLVFNMHHHHYANDIMGWTGFTKQLAETCRALVHGTPFPGWDPANMDRSRLTKAEPAEADKVEGPPAPQKHPDHVLATSLLFHLPKDKAARLKAECRPEDGTWVSTYDAFTAFMWRHLTRLRAPVFQPDMAEPVYLIEAVDMRKRLHSPPAPARAQGNVMCGATAESARVAPPSAADLISGWPLWRVARHIRTLTFSATQESLDATLELVATVRDKMALNVRINASPPMSILMTDHRDADLIRTDFGFGRPVIWRHLFDNVTEGLICVLPPRSYDPASNEGYEFVVAYEKRLVDGLLADPLWNEYFEYRGVDAEDVYNGAGPEAVPELVAGGGEENGAKGK